MNLILIKNGTVIDKFQGVNEFSSPSEGHLSFSSSCSGEVEFTGLKADYLIINGENLSVGDELTEEEIEQLITQYPLEEYRRISSEEEKQMLLQRIEQLEKLLNN